MCSFQHWLKPKVNYSPIHIHPFSSNHLGLDCGATVQSINESIKQRFGVQWRSDKKLFFFLPVREPVSIFENWNEWPLPPGVLNRTAQNNHSPDQSLLPDIVWFQDGCIHKAQKWRLKWLIWLQPKVSHYLWVTSRSLCPFLMLS